MDFSSQLERVMESSPVIVLLLIVITSMLWRKIEKREEAWEQLRKEELNSRDTMMNRMIASEQQMTRAVEQLVQTLRDRT